VLDVTPLWLVVGIQVEGGFRWGEGALGVLWEAREAAVSVRDRLTAGAAALRRAGGLFIYSINIGIRTLSAMSAVALCFRMRIFVGSCFVFG